MRAILDVVRVLFEPTAVFAREQPRFIAPVVTIMILSVIIGFLSLPYVEAAIAPMLAQAAPARGGTAPDAGKIAIGQIVGSAVFVPIFVALAGGILWVALSIFGEEAKYRLLTSVAAYTSITYILQLLASFAALSIRGVETVTSPSISSPPSASTS